MLRDISVFITIIVSITVLCLALDHRSEIIDHRSQIVILEQELIDTKYALNLLKEEIRLRENKACK